MRYIILLFLPFLGIYFQSTLFRAYSIKGTVPDVVLVFVIFYALFSNEKKGAVYGVFCGLIEDLYIGRYIGISALSKAITAYVVGRLQGNVFKENIVVGIIAVMIGTVVNSLVFLLLASIKFQTLGSLNNVLSDILYQAVYNMIITVPMYIWFYRSLRRGLLRETGDD